MQDPGHQPADSTPAESIIAGSPMMALRLTTGRAERCSTMWIRSFTALYDLGSADGDNLGVTERLIPPPSPISGSRVPRIEATPNQRLCQRLALPRARDGTVGRLL